MSKVNRRKFLYSTALAVTMPPIFSSFGSGGNEKRGDELKIISLGLISPANNPEEELKVVRDLGFSSCQLNIKDYSPELAKRLSLSLQNYRLTPTTLICHGPGPYKYNFIEGPSTIGLVPREYRKERVVRLKQGIDFCKETGIPAVHAHFGFIPENPKDKLYIEFVDTMKNLGEYGVKQGVDIYFETGQETPPTLCRVIEDIGTGNLFVNYDTANSAMYGKANPLDGLKMLAKYVKALHAKDGNYPINPNQLGKEVLIPEGEVDFPAIISFLKEINFEGSVTIECELTGNKRDYILNTKKYLEKIISSTTV